MAETFLTVIIVTENTNTENGEVCFHPVVLVVTILLVGITIFLAIRKPAKMEAAVSPIEALGYRPSHNASKIRKAGEGNLLTRLFGEQFTKDKKRTFMVLLSLAASLSVYLCVVTMLDSQAARTIVSNFMDSDLTGWNGSIVERIRE